MSDERVAALLESDAPLVVIEAPAGCGKTYQGARYASKTAKALQNGRILILTHTHAACSVFANETRSEANRVEIKTIDSLITAIATAYYKSLSLPPDPATWASQQGPDGFAELAVRVQKLIQARPMIAKALAARYPVVIGDEHQDSSVAQHAIIMALKEAGAVLRIFGDPMQNIYAQTKAERAASNDEWESLKAAGEFDKLNTPHRWEGSNPALGHWVLATRQALVAQNPIDLTGPLPQGLTVLDVENNAQQPGGYQLSRGDRAKLDSRVNTEQPLLILTGQNKTAQHLRAFWNRSIAIWEGYTRDALRVLVTAVNEHQGDADALAKTVCYFLKSVAVGFSRSSHGKRLLHETAEKCQKPTKGKPEYLQELAQCLLKEPDHHGVARCLQHLERLMKNRIKGFEDIKIDYPREYHDAIRLGEYSDVNEATKDMHRRRSYARPTPPTRAISTIHKAKGLQCEETMIVPCDAERFRNTDYARCKLYVGLSRARRTLTLVVSSNDPSPLFRLK